MTVQDAIIVDWFCDNQPRIDEILTDLNIAMSKLMEMEPVCFHDDIREEFYDLAIQKIADVATKDLALPIEMVYNTIEDKALLIETLRKSQN